VKRVACPIDRNRALPLARTADRGNFPAVMAHRRDEFPSRTDKSVPPILGSLFGTYAIDDIQRNWTEGPLEDEAVKSYERTLAPGRPQVYG
jgi:hypothetical protein